MKRRFLFRIFLIVFAVTGLVWFSKNAPQEKKFVFQFHNTKSKPLAAKNCRVVFVKDNKKLMRISFAINKNERLKGFSRQMKREFTKGMYNLIVTTDYYSEKTGFKVQETDYKTVEINDETYYTISIDF